MEIKGKSVLSYIIERVEQVVPREQIIVATSVEESDNPIVEFAERSGVACHRGSLENVAERFLEAALQLNADYACRINGDNIFLDTSVLKEMIEVAKSGKYRFLSNVKGRTFPKGMSVEIVEVAYFEQQLPTINQSSYYREHVMVYLYEREATDAHFYLKNEQLPEAAGLQLALDTREDFARSQWIIEHLNQPHWHAGMREILKLTSDYEQSTKG